MRDFIESVREEVGPSPVGAPIRQPLTLDDVSKRIKTICDDYLTEAIRVKAHFDQSLDVLASDVEASPDLDQNAVGALVMSEVHRMMENVAKAVG